MEWTLDLVRGFGGTEARVLDADGAIHSVPLTEMYRRGLPAAMPEVSGRYKVNLAGLRPTQIEPELQHLGFQFTRGVVNKHGAFELLIDEHLAVLPALLLMRGLFAPARHFLPAVFQPQALDSISWLAPTDEGYRSVIDANWYKTAVHTNNVRDCAPVIAWLRSCRSAEKMLASIHMNALRGVIALQPPQATADVKLAGFWAGKRLFITELRLMSVSVDEAPTLSVEGFQPLIKFAARKLNGEKLGAKATPSGDVLPHPDGTYEISDSEWEVLAPMFESRYSNRAKLDQRRVHDGVLRKLATGTPWRVMRYSVGDWRNAAFAYRELKKKGRLQRFLETLWESRTQSSTENR
jgi:hypothetical protein